VLVFVSVVVAGNPSAGGADQSALLPGFFRAIESAIPNRAGVDTVRRMVDFGSHGVLGQLLVSSARILAGIAVAQLGSLRYDRRRSA
jgi:hypothetical protein